MSVAQSTRPDAPVLQTFAWWLGVFLLLNAVGIAWLNHDGIDIRTGFGPGIPIIAWSPTVTALIVAALVCGRDRLVELWRSVRRWRVGAPWYLFAIGLPIVFVTASNAIVAMASGMDAAVWWQAAGWAAFAGGFGPVFSGAIGEEIGWRGFVQPLLQRRLNALWACVIVGVLWGTWHLTADVISPHASTQFWAAATRGYVRMIATAILYGWLYNRTGGSLPIVMTAHAAHNIVVNLFPVPAEFLSDMANTLTALYGLAAVPAALALWRGPAPRFVRQSR